VPGLSVSEYVPGGTSGNVNVRLKARVLPAGTKNGYENENRVLSVFHPEFGTLLMTAA